MEDQSEIEAMPVSCDGRAQRCTVEGAMDHETKRDTVEGAMDHETKRDYRKGDALSTADSSVQK